MKAVLAIVGDNLDPELVSAALGGQPRKSGRKGEVITAKDAKGQSVSRPAISGFWQRVVSFANLGKADSAMEELFAGLTTDTKAWRQLSSQFRAEIAVHGVPRRIKSEGVFSEPTLSLLRERGLQLCLHEK
jgi:Domain of unknown function (DUF4279)